MAASEIPVGVTLPATPPELAVGMGENRIDGSLGDGNVSPALETAGAKARSESVKAL